MTRNVTDEELTKLVNTVHEENLFYLIAKELLDARVVLRKVYAMENIQADSDQCGSPSRISELLKNLSK